MSLLITLCASGGSVGIPKKNIKNLIGKPLIKYSYDHAIEFKSIYSGKCHISLSTDSDEIKKIYNSFGNKVNYKRNKRLASNNASKTETIKDLLEYEENRLNIKFDYILDLDISSPLRNLNDLNQAFQKFQLNKDALNIFSVSKANKNPYFNMVEKGEHGYYNLVKSSENFNSRQKSPNVFDMNASFYFYRRSFFERKNLTVITDKSMIYEIPHICFDLDHEIDFSFIEYLMINKLLDFKI